MRIFLACLPLALLLAAHPAVAVSAEVKADAAAPASTLPSTVAEAVFGQDLLADVRVPVDLDYTYRSHDHLLDRAVEAPIHMEVRSIAENGAKSIWLDLFEGQAKRQLGPIQSTKQNPLIIYFLQRDVAEMENLTGGSQHYFRNRIRAAFAAPAEAERIELAYAGREVPATRIAIRPFADDPQIARFPQFQDKVYEFVVADAVPGGIWRLATRVPDPRSGELILEESMTFAKETPRE